MQPFVSLFGISAVLALLVANPFHGPERSIASVSAKPYQDRLPSADDLSTTGAATAAMPIRKGPDIAVAGTKSDRLSVWSADMCAAQTWPHFSADCLASANGPSPSRAVRHITVESRDIPNTSVLLRLPQTEVAQR